MTCGTETKDLIRKDQKGYIRESEEFQYLGVKMGKEDKQENYIKNRTNKGRSITAMLNGVLWNRKITTKNELLICGSIAKSTVTYGAVTWKLNKNLESKRILMEIYFVQEIGEMPKIRKNRNTVITEKTDIKNSVLELFAATQFSRDARRNKSHTMLKNYVTKILFSIE